MLTPRQVIIKAVDEIAHGGTPLIAAADDPEGQRQTLLAVAEAVLLLFDAVTASATTDDERLELVHRWMVGLAAKAAQAQAERDVKNRRN